MPLTSLGVNKVIEIAFDGRKVETITEAKVLLLRDGKDLESELATRQKLPSDLTFALYRTPFGDVEVEVSKKGVRGATLF